MNEKVEWEVDEHNEAKLTTDYGKFIFTAQNDGEIRIRVNNGKLVSYNTSSNVLVVRPEPFWGEITIIGIIEHKIRETNRSARKKAEEIYEMMRGKNL